MDYLLCFGFGMFTAAAGLYIAGYVYAYRTARIGPLAQAILDAMDDKNIEVFNYSVGNSVRGIYVWTDLNPSMFEVKVDGVEFKGELNPKERWAIHNKASARLGKKPSKDQAASSMQAAIESLRRSKEST